MARPSTPPVPLAPARLRRLAWIVRTLIAVGAFGLVAALVWTWISPERALAQLKTVTEGGGPSGVAADTRVAGAALALLPLGLTLLALQRLWGLFGEYAQGRVFSHRALGCLRGFARCVLAQAIVSPLYAAVLSVIATWHNAPGTRQLNLNFSSDHYAMLLLGAVLLAISSVMAEAARAAEENAGFV
jgi:hypothetical protein